MTALVVRLDNEGDVLLAGPAVRAVAAAQDTVLLCGPRGRQAAELLPGPREVVVWRCPWIDPEPPPVDAAEVDALRERVRAIGPDVALILTSWHQSPLPMALVCKLAGVPRVAAVSTDYPGSLVDHAIREDLDQPEPERALSVARAAGFTLPPGDDGRLAVRPTPDCGLEPGYVVVHPGASMPNRAWSAERHAKTVQLLMGQGHRVVVTGGPDERELTARVAGSATDLGGCTTFAELAAVLRGARAVVVANTGPAHLAAAVGTPVVSLFAPTVPVERWVPYGVRTIVLHTEDDIAPEDVVDAVERL